MSLFSDSKVGCSQCNKTIALDDANCAISKQHGSHFVCDECVERLDGDIDTFIPQPFSDEGDLTERSNII